MDQDHFWYSQANTSFVSPKWPAIKEKDYYTVIIKETFWKISIGDSVTLHFTFIYNTHVTPVDIAYLK